jgi:hypothetical protein
MQDVQLLSELCVLNGSMSDTERYYGLSCSGPTALCAISSGYREFEASRSTHINLRTTVQDTKSSTGR